MTPSPDDFRNALQQSEQRVYTRLARIEETLYGDGKSNKGLVATVNLISETILGQKWRDYAFVAMIVLEVISLFLIALLFIRVY